MLKRILKVPEQSFFLVHGDQARARGLDLCFPMPMLQTCCPKRPTRGCCRIPVNLHANCIHFSRPLGDRGRSVATAESSE